MTHQFHKSRRTFLASAGAVALSMPYVTRGGAQERLKVSVITTQGTAGLAVQDVARTQGFLAEQGIDVEFLNVADASKTIAALIGGTADMCLWSGLSGVPAAVEKGAKLKIIGGSLLFPVHAIFSSRPEIKKVSDLVGKTVGIGALGSQLHQVMLAVLRKKNVDPSKVIFRNVGSSSDVFRAVVAGTVDAGPSEVYVFEQQAKYGVHSLDDGQLWTEVPEFTFQASYATDSAIAKKRQHIVKTLAAFCKTYRFISAPGSEEAWVKSFVKVAGRDIPEEARTQWRFIQKYKPYSLDLVLGPERINFMQQLNLDIGIQKRILPYEQVADMSLAREALALVR
jgi:ABC-type nitrate/sulfonate/bicarbonate transport system substrate-binding protein